MKRCQENQGSNSGITTVIPVVLFLHLFSYDINYYNSRKMEFKIAASEHILSILVFKYFHPIFYNEPKVHLSLYLRYCDLNDSKFSENVCCPQNILIIYSKGGRKTTCSMLMPTLINPPILQSIYIHNDLQQHNGKSEKYFKECNIGSNKQQE